MLEEVNHELYELCETAATNLIQRTMDVLNRCFPAVKVPESWSAKGYDYLDYIAYRVGESSLENLGSIRQQALDGVKMEFHKFTAADAFALAAYIIEHNEQVARHSDNPSDLEELDNHLPTEDEVAEFIVGCWEDWLYDHYEDVQPNVTEEDAITRVEGRKPITCPYCGGRIVPILYGEPALEAFEQAENGKIILGGCCIHEGMPDWECKQCGQKFGRK